MEKKSTELRERLYELKKHTRTVFEVYGSIHPYTVVMIKKLCRSIQLTEWTEKDKPVSRWILDLLKKTQNSS